MQKISDSLTFLDLPSEKNKLQPFVDSVSKITTKYVCFFNFDENAINKIEEIIDSYMPEIILCTDKTNLDYVLSGKQRQIAGECLETEKNYQKYIFAVDTLKESAKIDVFSFLWRCLMKSNKTMMVNLLIEPAKSLLNEIILCECIKYLGESRFTFMEERTIAIADYIMSEGILLPLVAPKDIILDEFEWNIINLKVIYLENKNTLEVNVIFGNERFGQAVNTYYENQKQFNVGYRMKGKEKGLLKLSNCIGIYSGQPNNLSIAKNLFLENKIKQTHNKILRGVKIVTFVVFNDYHGIYSYERKVCIYIWRIKKMFQY